MSTQFHLNSVVVQVTKTYLTIIETITYNEDKIRITGEMFSYISNNKEILSTNLKRVIKKKIKELYFDSRIDEAKRWWDKLFDEQLIS